MLTVLYIKLLASENKPADQSNTKITTCVISTMSQDNTVCL